jgi:anti-sigma-K factor RskA
MMSHQQASELLAVFALDAVEGDEHEQIEAHLAECPRCRAELDAHREVASALGNSVEPLPEGLWSDISSRLMVGPDEAPPPMPSLLRHETGDDFGGVTSFRTPRSGRPRASRSRLISVASLAAACAAAAVVLGVNLVDANNQVAHLQGAIGETAHTAVLAALETPGHKVVNLKTSDGHRAAEFVVLPSGQGYLVGWRLPELSPKETYQLWGVVNGQTISLGLLGRSPDLVTFTLAGSPKESRLGITAEPAGGSVLPSGAMLAAGAV